MLFIQAQVAFSGGSNFPEYIYSSAVIKHNFEVLYYMYFPVIILYSTASTAEWNTGLFISLLLYDSGS